MMVPVFRPLSGEDWVLPAELSPPMEGPVFVEVPSPPVPESVWSAVGCWHVVDIDVTETVVGIVPLSTTVSVRVVEVIPQPLTVALEVLLVNTSTTSWESRRVNTLW